MDQQTLINVAFGTIAAGIGWIIKSIYDAMNALKDDVKEIEREIHTEYVRKDDYKDDIHEIKEMLGAIWKKLDSKADK
jgi:Mg2+ and Co2+ transporter CorA